MEEGCNEICVTFGGRIVSSDDPEVCEGLVVIMIPSISSDQGPVTRDNVISNLLHHQKQQRRITGISDS